MIDDDVKDPEDQSQTEDDAAKLDYLRHNRPVSRPTDAPPEPAEEQPGRPPEVLDLDGIEQQIKDVHANLGVRLRYATSRELERIADLLNVQIKVEVLKLFATGSVPGLQTVAVEQLAAIWEAYDDSPIRKQLEAADRLANVAESTLVHSSGSYWNRILVNLLPLGEALDEYRRSAVGGVGGES